MSIAAKNDVFRQALLGQVFLTRLVEKSHLKDEILEAVKNFKDFNRGNDPWGEHDFAFFEVGRNTWFFKIDYYDDD